MNSLGPRCLWWTDWEKLKNTELAVPGWRKGLITVPLGPGSAEAVKTQEYWGTQVNISADIKIGLTSLLWSISHLKRHFMLFFESWVAVYTCEDTHTGQITCLPWITHSPKIPRNSVHTAESDKSSGKGWKMAMMPHSDTFTSFSRKSCQLFHYPFHTELGLHVYYARTHLQYM